MSTKKPCRVCIYSRWGMTILMLVALASVAYLNLSA
ncbi:disulfide bond formation protein B [Oceanobacter kriegii]|nr:disulfide bond formation protein B [Oceanobacter kriegii]